MARTVLQRKNVGLNIKTKLVHFITHTGTVHGYTYQINKDIQFKVT